MADMCPRVAKASGPRTAQRSGIVGIGQLTLVEHSLCPLDPRASLVENLVHDTGFLFTDADRRRRHGKARVICPAGLSAADEFYLWGLLALTLSLPEPISELQATPHYCLRRLGMIDQHARRGGRQYRQFTQAIDRLSLVRYRNDSFYDPLREEHRRVSFGFFSYSLPLDPLSSRTWRFAWDAIFFELARAVGGHFRFDLDIYRRLDPASRRLLLFVSKLFHRRASVRLDVRALAVDVLGFAPTVAMRNLKAKIGQCVGRLTQLGTLSAVSFEKTGRGQYALLLHRGAHFDRRRLQPMNLDMAESPVFDILRVIGFDERSIRGLIRQYPAQLLQQWADVTLAAKERHGPRFFKRSPQAFFIDNVRNAIAGHRTPPDWWCQLRKSEERPKSEPDRRDRQGGLATAGDILNTASHEFGGPLRESVQSLFRGQS